MAIQAANPGDPENLHILLEYSESRANWRSPPICSNTITPPERIEQTPFLSHRLFLIYWGAPILDRLPAWLASRNWLGTPTRCSSAHFPPWILFLKLHRAVPLFTMRVLIKNSCSKGFWQTLCQFLAGPSQNGSHVRGWGGVPMGKSKSGCDQVLATLFIHFTHWSR